METFTDIPGGKWWKFDFHLHTPGSYDYGHGDESQANISPKEFLICCMEKELDCIVITDHNTVRWIPQLRDALEELRRNYSKFRELLIFPGFEVNVIGNIHLLCVFDPKTPYEDLVSMLPLIGYDADTDTTTKTIREIIEIVTSKNGIAIPAHVDKPSGLFSSSPSDVRAALSANGLLAFEVVEQAFHNGQYADSKLHLSYVLGSDSHCTDTIADKFTWVKMGEPNIEALRLALFDTEDGVIRSIEDVRNPNFIQSRTYIKSLKVCNGQCIGRKEPYVVTFSPWLSNIIGGRGAGKSSILKFIRFMLDRRDELPEDLKSDFDSFACISTSRQEKGMLTNDTTIEMVMVVDGVEHTLKYENGNILEYDLENNFFVPATSITKRFPVRIFDQKQLFGMTKNPYLLFHFLDGEWDYANWKVKFETETNSYKKAAQELRELEEKKKKAKELNASIKDVVSKISVFETSKTQKILDENQRFDSYRKEIKRIYDSYYPIIAIEKMVNAVRLPAEIDLVDGLDEESAQTLNRWTSSLRKLYDVLSQAVRDFSEYCISYEMLEKNLKLTKLIAENNVQMKQILQELREAGVEGVDKYADLIKEKKLLELQAANYEKIEDEIVEKKKELQDCLEKIYNLVIERYHHREQVISTWNKMGNLRLKLLPFGELTQNEKTFREIIRKDSGFDNYILYSNADSDEPEDGIIYRIAQNDGDITKAISNLKAEKKNLLGISSESKGRFFSSLRNLYEKHIESVDELTTWIPDDKICLEIKVGKHYKPVDVGSPGQRTSAILSLIFEISKTPIIIDQPEDDLDTRNITEIVVNSINNKKKSQQIIIVTHNPNIVVNTNSEQVIQLDYVNGQIVTVCSGALQDHAVRDGICNVMEGGKEALEKRYYRIFKALEN